MMTPEEKAFRVKIFKATNDMGIGEIFIIPKVLAKYPGITKEFFIQALKEIIDLQELPPEERAVPATWTLQILADKEGNDWYKVKKVRLRYFENGVPCYD